MSADNDQRMRRVGIWLGEQFGNVPFFVGVQPRHGGPLSISSVDTRDQIRLLKEIQKSLEGPTAVKFVDKEPVPLASSFDVSIEDVRRTVWHLKVLSEHGHPEQQAARARVCKWLEAWAEGAKGK